MAESNEKRIAEAFVNKYTKMKGMLDILAETDPLTLKAIEKQYEATEKSNAVAVHDLMEVAEAAKEKTYNKESLKGKPSER